MHRKTRIALLMLIGNFIIYSLFACQEKKLPTSNETTIQPASITEDIEGIPTTELSRNIRSMLHDSKGNYWFGSDAEGVYRFNGKNYIQFTYKEGLGDNQIRSIEEDKAGNIWVGTGRGISRFDGKKFTPINDENNFGLINTAHAQWISKPNDLWFEASDKREGVYRYDGTSLSLLRLPKNSMDGGFNAEETQTAGPYAVYCIYKDRKGYVWFGTQALGVCCFTGNSFFWLSEKQLSGPAVRAIFEDSKGNMWFGNNGGGLFIYDGKTLRNLTAENGLGNTNFMKGKDLNNNPGTLARVWSITEDASGDIWASTIDAGVWRYEGKTLTNYTEKDGLSMPSIPLIFKDRKGDLWFCSEGGGIMKFNGKSFYAI